MKLGKYKDAYLHFLKAHGNNKHQLEGLEYYSTCLWHMNQQQKLLKLSEQFFEEFPSAFQTWVLLGNCYSVLNDHISAIKFFKRAIQIEKNNSYVFCLLGHELMIVEDYDVALKSYERALHLNKTEFYAYWGMGNVFLKKDQNQKAFNYFSLASNLNPNCSVLYTYMGLTQSNLGKFDMALLYFERTENLDPANLVNIFHKAQAYYNLNMIH